MRPLFSDLPQITSINCSVTTNTKGALLPTNMAIEVVVLFSNSIFCSDDNFH